MADDLQIKPAGNGAGQPQTTSAASGTAQNIPQGPVIDLRGLDQNGAQGSAASAQQTGQSASDESFTSPTGQIYSMPQNVRDKFPDLMKLIKETESMNDEEREYWFQILPIMTDEQIKKFRDILVNEKEQLTKLDKEYEAELTKLNEKHMVEWKSFESKEKRKALTAAEQKSKAQEVAEEEALLKQLSQV